MTTYSAKAPLASTPMIFTCWQMCASPMRHCRHLPQATCISAETKSPSLHAGDFVADGFDGAAELVAGNERRMNAALRPLVPLINVQVGAADGGHLDFDQHVGRVRTCGMGTSRISVPGAGSGFTTASMVSGMRTLYLPPWPSKLGRSRSLDSASLRSE